MSTPPVLHHSHLRRRGRAMIMPIRVALLLAFYGVVPCALAQEAADAQREELDVTMQIIADPDAKQPDEVVRRIPLPVRKPDAPSEKPKGEQRKSDPAKADPGREVAENAKDRAKQAVEQREEAQRAVVNERRRNPDPPSPPRPRPPRPPRD